MTASDRDEINRIFSNLGKAIEAYERKLIGGPAPFDTYVEGLRTGAAGCCGTIGCGGLARGPGGLARRD